MNENLLEIKNLNTTFYTSQGKIKAVNDVSFSIKNGRIMGIVGESGSGKSITALSIMGLVPKPHGVIDSGEILLNGTDILKLSEKEMCCIRGKEISIIFQEPMTALNPIFTVGEQIGEILRIHQHINTKDIRNKVIQLLDLVQIPRPKKIIDEYPFQLSGGMRQRVIIAMAIACNPKLIIADEPTTALDVTIQAQILELLKDLTKKLETSIMLITHDLGVIAEMAQDVVVMYAGQVVEECNVIDFFQNTLHPYSKGLINSRPDNITNHNRLYSISGMIPNPYNMPKGCPFNPRCKRCMPICVKEVPKLIEIHKGHRVRCWIYSKNRGVDYA